MEKTAESQEMTRRTTQEASYPEQLRQSPHVTPDIDILERPDEFILRADVPGAGAETSDIRVENQTLSISCRVKRRLPSDVTYLVSEYDVSDYYREFLVGELLDATKITAEYADGVLTVHLPKAETMKTRKIEVQKK